MKKYKAPNCKVLEIEDEEIIATSNPIEGGKVNNSVGDDVEYSKMLNIVNMGDDEELTWE